MTFVVYLRLDACTILCYPCYESRKIKEKGKGNQRLIKPYRFEKHQMRIDANAHQVHLLGRTTRDGNDLAVNPAAVFAGKESNHTGDVLGDGTAAERAVVGHELLDLLGGPLGCTTRDVVL